MAEQEKCPKCGGEVEYSPDSSGWNCDACELLEMDWVKSQLAQAEREALESLREWINTRSKVCRTTILTEIDRRLAEQGGTGENDA